MENKSVDCFLYDRNRETILEFWILLKASDLLTTMMIKIYGTVSYNDKKKKDF